MNKKILLSLMLSVAVVVSCFGVAATEVVQERTDRTHTLDAEITVFGNAVMIDGEVVGGIGGVPISYVVMVGDKLICVRQSVSEADGSFAKQLLLDPELYGAETVAICCVSGYDVNTIKRDIPLYGKADLDEVIPKLLPVDTQEDYVAFLERFGSMLELTDLLRYPDATYLHFEEEKPSALSNINDLAEWTKGFRDACIVTVNLLDEMNKASQNQKWGTIMTLLTDTYKDVVTANNTLLAGIEDEQALYMRMTGQTYTTIEGINDAWETACEEQAEAEKNGTKKPATKFPLGGGGFGGGSTSSVKYVPPAETEDEEAENKETENITLPETQFNDLENVGWAVEAINNLRERGVVHGDGSGNFEPDRQVTREEMLAMLIGAFRVPEAAEAKTEFIDVSNNEWFYSVVAQAEAIGLVNGLGDGSFGAGQPVKRADMAVMAMRLMDILNKDVAITEPAIVFEDYFEIPDYASEMISRLQQAGVLNGDDTGSFNPSDSASRAEAAVVIHNLIKITEG